MIGVIGGSTFLDQSFLKGARLRKVSTKYGSVSVLKGNKACFLQRHGSGVPPHRVKHRANILTLKKLGVRFVIGVSSCASLKKSLKPGSIVIIDDFMQLSGIPTFFDDSMVFATPEISEKLRLVIIDSAREAGINVRTKGTYIQAQGPRLETRAEIRMMQRFADVVGMTVASEATLACEQGLEYSCICSVDNYAHGIAGERVEWKNISIAQKKSAAKVRALISKAIGNIQ